MNWLPLRNGMSRWFSVRPAAPARSRRKPGYRPTLEFMEERLAPAALRTGFDSTSYGRTDDASYSGGAQSLGFTINFFGNTHTTVFVNNNGNVTFDSGLTTFTPFNLTSTSREIVAPFFADVDTSSAGNETKFGTGTVDGHNAFGVSWRDVDYYQSSSSHTNRNFFQVILIDRSDIATGDFDIEFNYDQIQWETGQASSGNSSGLGGNSARVGFSNGTGNAGTFYELNGSAVNGAFLDNNSSTGLIHHSLNSSVLGRYIFFARNGTISVGAVNVVQSGNSTTVTEGGASDSWQLSLGTAPTSDVTITIGTNSQLNITPTTLVFTPSNYATPQTVTVTAIDDFLAQGNRSVMLTQTLTSADTVYDNLPLDPITVAIADNDVVGIVVTETAGSTDVTEGGQTDSYSVVLTSQPTADVVVTLNSGNQLNVSASTLTFTPANWSTPQIVSVSAIDDSEPTGNRNVTITHTASSGDMAYNNFSVAGVVVHITDNEFVNIAVNPAGPFTLLEGKSRSYTVSLNAAPTADVTVSLTTPSSLSLSATTLVFTSSNWSTSQTVVATAVNNESSDGNQVVTIDHAVVSDDARYDGFQLASITVSIVDDDGALLVVGTERNDRISVISSPTLIQTIVNGVSTYYSTSYTQVLVLAGGGDDSIILSAPTIATSVIAAAGKDTVQIDGRATANQFDAGSFDVTLNGVDITLGDVEVVSLKGKNAADILNLLAAPTFALSFNGGSGSDTIVGPNQTNAWKITGTDAGSLNGQITFTSVENPTGNAGDDTFSFTAGKLISGRINGGGGVNTLDYSAFRTPITANLTAGTITATRGFQNITNLRGGSSSDKLIGPNTPSTWNITGNDAGTVDAVSFSSFENLTGGSANDTFAFAAGVRMKGKIDGGAGVDTLDFSAYTSSFSANLQTKTATGMAGWLNMEGFVGGSGLNAITAPSKVNVWTFTGVGTGTITGGFSFQNFQNLFGGALADLFNFSGGAGDWTGLLDGGAGIDTLVTTGGTYVPSGINAGTFNGRNFRSIENRQ